MTTELTDAQRQQMLNEKRGRLCSCGKKKPRGQAFCDKEFEPLPPEIKKGLGRLLSDGYIAFYFQALKWLERRATQPSLIR